jgi:small multidrug resistance family-3 protein
VVATLAAYLLAAIAEIAGCFAFWIWLRQARSPLWVGPGLLCLIVFAAALTRVDSAFAGRAFAAYGGIYIMVSVVWLRLVERAPVSRWDALGTALCLMGSAVIIVGGRVGR